MAIRHNHRLHVDFDVKFNPALYATIAQHMNVYEDPPRWAIYLPDDDVTLWPENSIEMPTLQEFMVRDTDIYPHATIPVGKVLVDIEFEQPERRRHHAIEKKRGERALKRSEEVEGKLSAEQRAKLASKQKSVKDSYEKRRAAKEAEGPSGSSAVNDETNMET
ncbi:hypothetical protein B0H14DRAFT_2714187 [Mycena olivaceomarginata]|nr:hypothetical protein B0H14DRAFT_2714187 [Mycena olivaceomarginata]